MPRKAISKKLRFEVFKRDSFTCQYCGNKAPDVLLHIDHINPVSKGGDNDILNLLTSCVSCNLGKKARKLDDNAELDKQRRQLEDLQERRTQIEMMIQWRDGLKSIESDLVSIFEDYVYSEFGGSFSLSETGLRNAKSWLKKYSYSDLCEAVDICGSQYLKYVEGKPTKDSWEKAFTYIPKVAHNRKLQTENPELYEVNRIKSYIRRNHFINEGVATSLIISARHKGYEFSDIWSVATGAKNWTQFRNTLETWIYGEVQ